ncbi:MAG: hypothetical protein Q7K57_35605 [Burkholderiaceae bacterium]|nr:hypothetical protein [Burkholderiaceae bacterium]
MNLRTADGLAASSNASEPAWRTEIRLEPLVVGLFWVPLQLGLEKVIQPACQLLPVVAQVGVPPVSALAVLLDMQMVTQLFRLMASIRAREMSLENSVVMAAAWLRTRNSLKFGRPNARIRPRTTIVTISSMMVNPDPDLRGATRARSGLDSKGFKQAVEGCSMGSV